MVQYMGMLNEAELPWPQRDAKWDYSSLHENKLDKILICPGILLTPYDMYNRKLPG
jgi:hypothetical protein